MSIIRPKLNPSRGLQTLTAEGHDLLRRCIRLNPDGCRSSDGECGPPPTYPCFMLCGLSWDEWDKYFSQFKADERDRNLAQPLDEGLIQ